MPDPTPFILGAGSVGLGLALALKDKGIVPKGMWNRRETENLREFSAQIAAPVFTTPLSKATREFREVLEGSSLVILAVSDDSISNIAHSLIQNKLISPDTVLTHLSGCLTADILRKGPSPFSGSFHPLTACPTPHLARQTLADTFFTLEGGQAAVPILERLIKQLGGRSKTINGAQKEQYHAAAVLASNLMVALLAIARDEAAEAGLEGLENELASLAIGALRRTQDCGMERGLTGPLVRGDRTTITQHLGALSPSGEEAYRLLSLRALSLIPEGKLTADTKEQLAKALSKDSP